METFPERPRTESLLQRRRAQRRRWHALLLGLAVLAGAFGIYMLSQFESIQRSYIYPYPYRDTVERYAEQYGVDSHLAAAVILSESHFQNDVHSHRGAVGLMQLMPDTAAWIAYQLDDEGYSVTSLHEPERNIRYGVWYLASLEHEFQNNDVLALAAYNAGRGNVRAWIQEEGWPEDFSDIGRIPYNETRAYVARVLAAQRKYRDLYP